MTGPTWVGSFTVGDVYQLIPGRYPCTFDDIAAHWGFNAHRIALLDELKRFVAEVQLIVPVASVWIAGSYLTSKDDPSDIDITLVISEDAINNVSGQLRALLTVQGMHQLAQHLNVRVDPYVLPWMHLIAPDPNLPDQARYYVTRGYWDDWWVRFRDKSVAESAEVQALPRMGYLEVILNGYP